MRKYFLPIVLSVFSATAVYLIWSLSLHALGIGVLLGGFAAVLWLPLVFWQKDGEEVTRFEFAMLWLAFGSMGFLSLLWVMTLVRDLASLLLPVALHTALGNEAVFAATAVAFLVGMLNAFFGLKIREIEIPIENLAPALEGIRIVQLTDVHVGSMVRERALKRIAARVREAKPDIIVFTGDAVDGGVSDLGELMRPLAELDARFGKFYVPGNHEYYWGVGPWLSWFAQAGYRVLLNRNETVRIGDSQLLMVGVADPAAAMTGPKGEVLGGEAQNLTKALEGAPAGARPRILLAHQPAVAREAEAHGIDLQISGHTHGGQFFPWTIVVGFVHEFPQGLKKLKKMWVYVSRGTGYWGPPVRLGAPPEVSLLILKKAN
jgi:predicted MPP superfamily phosphohydrolase